MATVFHAIKWYPIDIPTVTMVRPERRCWDQNPRIRGFMDEDSGTCVYGMFFAGQIWLTEQLTGLFSYSSLTHEMLHSVGLQHARPGSWNKNDPEWTLIQIGNAALRADVEADKIPVEITQ